VMLASGHGQQLTHGSSGDAGEWCGRLYPPPPPPGIHPYHACWHGMRQHGDRGRQVSESVIVAL
jgi:hypothetical protein